MDSRGVPNTYLDTGMMGSSSSRTGRSMGRLIDDPHHSRINHIWAISHWNWRPYERDWRVWVVTNLRVIVRSSYVERHRPKLQYLRCNPHVRVRNVWSRSKLRNLHWISGKDGSEVALSRRHCQRLWIKSQGVQQLLSGTEKAFLKRAVKIMSSDGVRQRIYTITGIGPGRSLVPVVFRTVDTEFILPQIWVFRQYLLDSSPLGSVDFVLMAIASGVVVKLTCPGTGTKMVITLPRDIFLTYIAHDASALDAGHLVTPHLLDDLDFAPRAGADEGFAHGLFHEMTFWDAPFLLGLLARLRDVSLLPAEAAADPFALRVTAAEFTILRYWRADCLEFAKRAVLEALNARLRNFILLLQGLQLSHHRWPNGFTQPLSAETGFAAADVEALHLVLHESNLCFCTIFDAAEAEEVGIIPLARYCPIRWGIGKATLAFYEGSCPRMLLLIQPLGVFQLLLAPDSL